MSASFRITGLSLGCLLGGLSWCLAVEGLLGGKTNQLLEIRSLSVNGKPVSLHPGKKLRMSPAPRNVAFGFGTATNLPRAPLRVRYKLDGFEDNWREVSSDLSISFRFIDANQDPVSENAFRAAGQTEGWTGALDTSAFLHRRETILVPPGAKGLWVSVSSAGPPNTVGMYAITNLVVTRLPTNNQPSAVLLRWDSDAKGEFAGSEWVPADWTRNGLRISMAKITQFGPNQELKALTLLDNDPNAHAEWTTRKEAALAVAPGERLLLEWDEAFSLGLAGPAEVNYADLPHGVQVSSHVRHDLIMAVKEAVHNVIKHAKASELSVYIDWEETTLTIRVQDNGCGLAPATHSAGSGLANMKRRLEHAGGTCSFHSEPGHGTTVVFRADIQSPG